METSHHNNSDFMDVDQEKVIFLDWDDTMFPTSFLRTYSHEYQHRGLLSDHVISALQCCEKSVRKLLLIFKSMTRHVYIITNALQGWVENSVAMYYPTLATDGTFDNVTIISARSRYSHINSHINSCDNSQGPLMWKYFAMSNVMDAVMHNLHFDILSNDENITESLLAPLSAYDKMKLDFGKMQSTFGKTELIFDKMHSIFGKTKLTYGKTIISIGDSEIERDAVQLVHCVYQDTVVKIMKMIKNPQSCDHLRVQLDLIHDWVLSTYREQIYVDHYTIVNNEDMCVKICERNRDC